MADEIPVRPSVAHQDLQVPLEGRVYTLELRWAVREERWYLDVYDEDKEPIYTAVAVVLNFPLGIRCADARWWPGALMAVDTSGANADPGLADLGATVKLLYYTAEELGL